MLAIKTSRKMDIRSIAMRLLEIYTDPRSLSLQHIAKYTFIQTVDLSRWVLEQSRGPVFCTHHLGIDGARLF
ncbi:MAG: hypothetical protein ACI88C_000906 [Acidimicrobiales bacterium]